jgi:hypothetical protein
MPEVKVKVTTCCDKIRVTPDHLHIKKGDELVWDCDADALEIDFGASSPFAPVLAAAKSAGVVTVSSGSQRAGRQPGPYKYMVRVAKNGKELKLDPDVVVDPP